MGKQLQPAPDGSTILVVDDDPAVRNSLKFSLEIEGFSVRVYANGMELLKDSNLPGHGCLVVDYNMPGMTGLDLVDELRHRHFSLPVVLITTHPSDVVRKRATAAGVALVEKPLLSGALFLAINDSLARASASGIHSNGKT